MLPNYTCWGGVEAYRREVTITNTFWLKMEKSFEKERHYLIISSMHGWRKLVCYLFMPLGVNVFLEKMGEILEIIQIAIYLPFI